MAGAVYQIGEYTVEARRVPLIENGRLQHGTAYNVTHPSPEGWPRWCGMGRTREEAEELIGRDLLWRIASVRRMERSAA